MLYYLLAPLREYFIFFNVFRYITVRTALAGITAFLICLILGQHMADGALSSGMRADQIFSFKNSEEAAEEILTLLQEGDLILVKGSRKIEIEKIVERLKMERQ